MSSFYWLSVNPVVAVIAAAATLAGLSLIYRGWRTREPRWLLPGWFLVALSGWPWTLAAGTDTGLALGAVVGMLSAMALVAAQGQWRTSRSRRRNAPDRDTPENGARAVRPAPGTPRARTRRALARLMTAGPVSAAAALILAMLLVAHVPWSESDRLVAAALLAPLLWGVGMAWSCADTRPLRPLACLAMLSLASMPLLPIWS